MLDFTLVTNIRSGLFWFFALIRVTHPGVCAARYLGWKKNGEVSKRSVQRSDDDTSLKILQSVFPRVASDLVTPLSHTDNLVVVK